MPAFKRTFGPLALTTTLTTNVYAGAGGSALVYDVIRHIHVTNKTVNSAKFTLYLGASGANAAGTELFKDQTVAANSSFDYYSALKMTSTDFLVGGADTATALTIMAEGEQYVV